MYDTNSFIMTCKKQKIENAYQLESEAEQYLEITQKQRDELREEFYAPLRQKATKKGKKALRLFNISGPNAEDWMEWECNDYNLWLEDQLIIARKKNEVENEPKM